MPPPVHSYESPRARVLVFGLAAGVPILAHAKDKYFQPLLGGWVLLGLAELGLLVGMVLLMRATTQPLAKPERGFIGYTFDLPHAAELAVGSFGAVVLGLALYATSILGAFDRALERASPIAPISVAAAIFFVVLGSGLILVRPVFHVDDSGARCTLFGTGLPLVVFQTPREKLTVVTIEKPMVDASRRITGVLIQIRGKAGPLTFSLPRDEGLPTFLGPGELSQKESVVAAWCARLTK